MTIRIILLASVLLASCKGESRFPANERYPNAPVVLISIDTLRADHLPAYGYSQVATPHLDAFRRDSILFRNAYSHVPLTLPSHATLLTGKLPADNGVRDNLGYRLESASDSLPQLLRAHGYATAAAVSSYVLRGETGLRSLFDDYDDAIPFRPGVVLGDVQRRGEETAAVAEKWIDAHRDRPFFYFLHVFEPHAPYDPPEPFRSRYSNRYDGEIATVDDVVGRFLEHLKSIGVYDRAIVVLLSDHGEGLGDHGEQEHGVFLYRESIHVPLMIKLPKGAASNATVDAPVGLIDVLPTIASLTGATIPAAARGKVLLGELPERRIFSESMYGRLHFGWSELRSLVDREHHFIDAPAPELYRLANDEHERENVLQNERRVYASFRKDIEPYRAALHAPGNVSAEEAKKFAALGYSTGRSESTGPLPDPKEHIGELALFNEATSLIATLQYDRAIVSLRALLQKNPRFSDALFRLASAYEATGKFEDAANTYRELLRANPSMTEQVALALGANYLNLGRLDEAKAHAELAITRNPGGAHLLLGRIALARNDLRDAEREARAASADEHYAGEAALLGADVLAKQRKYEAALALLNDAKRTASLRNLELARADALMHLGRVDEAVAAFREEMRLFPDNRDAYANLAAVYLLQQRAADAESVFQSLVTANPTRASYILAAETFEQLGQRAAGASWRARAAAVAQ